VDGCGLIVFATVRKRLTPSMGVSRFCLPLYSDSHSPYAVRFVGCIPDNFFRQLEKEYEVVVSFFYGVHCKLPVGLFQ
jgi:hypothetical protein